MKKIPIHSLAFVITLLMSGCHDEKPTLFVYTWADYYAPDLIEEFERINGCNVSITTFSSNEEMYAKLKSGATGYDVINPTSYQIPTLVSEGLIERLDISMLPNVATNFDVRFMKYVSQPANEYAVSYMISYGGLLVDTNKVNLSDAESWAIFMNPKYRGRMSLLNDIREVIGAALMAKGYSVNATNRNEIEEAVGLIKSNWKPNIRKMDSESYKTEVPSGSIFVAHAYSSDSLQAIIGDGTEEKRGNLVFVTPKEGFTICSDEFVIMKNSKKKNLAYRFIDFFYETENCRENMEYVGSLTPHRASIELLDKEFRDIILPSEERLSKAQVIENFDNVPEIFEMYNEYWDAVLKIKD